MTGVEMVSLVLKTREGRHDTRVRLSAPPLNKET